MAAKLTDRASIPAVIAEMTLEEKALLCTGDSNFTTYPIERLGIPRIWLLDGATGINLGQLYADLIYLHKNDPEFDFGGEVTEVTVSELRSKILNPETMSEKARRVFDVLMKYMDKRMVKHILPGCFPPGMMIGAAGNSDVAYTCGSAMARELDAYGIDMVLGPTINIHRDPRNGRVYEGYSEDPCVVGQLASAFVVGMQDEGIIADCKHFAANSQETNRANINEIISKRAMYEIYLPGFKACVDAGLDTIMSAYNRINGAPCSMNKWLLKDVLRDEWGFDGLVVSDWGGAYEQDKALAAGNDLIMPGKREIDTILNAVKEGTLSIEDLDTCVANVLKIILKSNTFKGGRKHPVIDVEYSRKAAYDIAAEGTTLLKNDGVLPLKEGSKLAFFGEGCKHFIESGMGSTYIRTDRSTALIKMCENYAGSCNYDEINADDDAVIITVRAIGQEGSDRAGLGLDAGEKEMALAAIDKAREKGKKVILVLNVSGPVDLREYENKCSAIVCIYLPGMEGGRALADILFGKVNPSGKLPITFPVKLEDVPAYLNFPGTPKKVVYGEGIFVGYRYYEFKKIKPMYAFGHGLSYTSFEFSDVTVDKKTLDTDKDETVKLTVSVTNTGAMDGKETVQLYVADKKSVLIKPVKELKAFKKVMIKAGETVKVEFEINKDMLKSYDDDLNEWTVEPGEYALLVGDASDKIFSETIIDVSGYSPYNFCKTTALTRILHHDEARALLYEYIDKCSWDVGRLDDAAEYFPDREMLAELKYVFDYESQADLWEEFFEKIKNYS